MPPPHPSPDPAAGLRLAAALLRGRPALAAGAGLALLGLLGGLLPLLDVPGYELGLLGAWLGVALAGPLGLAAARRERDRPGGSPGVAALAAALAATALLLALLATSALRAAFGPCRALFGAAFFPVLALPSAWLAAALTAGAAWWRRGRAGATAALMALAALASLAWTLLEAWRGPAAFALDHLLGVWPGPLYDEALALDSRLLLFRAATVGLAVAVGGAATLLAGWRGHPRRTGPLLWLAAGLATFGGARLAMRQQVLDGDRAAIARALGGRLDGPACTVHFPAEKPGPAADALLADCEFHAADVATVLGLAGPPHVTVFVHRSDVEKRRHVGAGATSYTKPWLGEIHLTDAPWPHPVLRHELVHALAGSFAPGPFRVAARGGVLVSTGVVEGLAMAIDLPRGEWTLHEWTRAMRDLGVMPPIERLLGPAGFFSAAPARAYTASGSFIRFLLDRYGPEKVRALYATVDFERSFGQPLSQLVADWSAFLDAVPVAPELRSAAEARFHDPGLLRRTCARQVAELESRASALWERGSPGEAAPLWRAAADLSGEPGYLRAEGNAWRAAGEPTCASRAYQDALAAAGTGRSALRASVEEALGDLGWKAGRAQEAIARYRTALPLASDRSQTRALQAKLAALSDPRLAEATSGWLLGTEPPGVAMARLARSREPLAVYLLGRAYLSWGAPDLARPELAAAAAMTLPSPTFQVEARRLLAEADLRLGDWKRAIDGALQLAREADRVADGLRASDDAERCRFEQETYGVPAASATPSERCGASTGGPRAGP